MYSLCYSKSEVIVILDLLFFSLWKAVYIHFSGSLNVASLNVKTHIHMFWNVFLNSLVSSSPFSLSSFVELFIHILNLFLNCFFISLCVSLSLPPSVSVSFCIFFPPVICGARWVGGGAVDLSLSAFSFHSRYGSLSVSPAAISPCPNPQPPHPILSSLPCISLRPVSPY